MKRFIGGLMIAALVLRWSTEGVLDRVATDNFGSLIGLLAASVAWAAYGWLLLAVAGTLLERLPGAVGRSAALATRVITSAGTRVLLRSALGVAATAPLTVAAAHATPTDLPHDHGAIAEAAAWDPRTGVERASTVPASDLQREPVRHSPSDRATSQLAVPDRPTLGAETRYTPVHRSGPRTIVVRPGDSLWTIAARELGPHATRTTIDRRWPRWYAANADRIGPDPGLIRPGQHLLRPNDPTTPDAEK